jgi:hypothetical protein
VRLTEEQKRLAVSGFGLDFRADLLYQGRREIESLPVQLGGDLTIDFNADIRRRCNLVVPGLDEWIPLSGDDPLFPTNRYEIALRAVMSFRGGNTADVPLGVFRIQKPKVTITTEGDRAIGFEGYDRGLTVSRHKLEKSVTITSSSSLNDFLNDILGERLPATVDFRFEDIDLELGFVPYTLQWDQGTDVWAESIKLVRELGYDLFMNDYGDCLITQTFSQLQHTPDFTHKSGQSATIREVTRTLDDENTYNWIIVRGENTDGYYEVQGEAFDSDPNSITYIGAQEKTSEDFGKGAFGAKLNVITNQVVQTNRQANNVAVAELYRSVGIEETLEVETIWLPHDVNEKIFFILPELGLAHTYQLDAVRLTLAPEGIANMVTRRRRTEGV